jgi:hypothetical protein
LRQQFLLPQHGAKGRVWGRSMAGYQNFKAHLTQDYNLIKDLPYYSDASVNNVYVDYKRERLVQEFRISNSVLGLSIPAENYWWMKDKPLQRFIKPYMDKVILKLQELFSNPQELFSLSSWKAKIINELGRLFRYEKRMWRTARALAGQIWGWNNMGICSKVLLEKRCVKSECEEGKDKVYIQALSCGRMNCVVCGQPYSLAHLECYLKVLSILIVMRKLSSKGSLGLLVITFPAEKRFELANKGALSKIRKEIRDLLCPGEKPSKISKEIAKKYGIKQYNVVFDVWHFAGEESSPRYHPHLNVVIPEGYLEKEELENIKKAISELSIKVLGFPCNVWYGYKTEGEKVEGAIIDTDSKLIHLARYLSRPTFLMQDEVSYEAFKNFQKYGHRGLREYLSKDDSPKSPDVVKEMVEMMIENGEIKSERQRIEFLVRMNRCPFCYERMKCRRIMSVDDVYEDGDKVIEISGFVYMIIKEKWSPPEDDWEPGMSDIYYITEEDIKKAQKEIEERKK